MIAAQTFAPSTSASQSARAAGSFARRPALALAVHVDRDGVPPLRGHWLAAALDELDYGIVLLLPSMDVVHINDAARAELDDCHPLHMIARELRPRLARDLAPLHEAVSAAALRGMRRLVTLGKDADRTSVSVVPLEGADGEPRTVLIVLGKRAVCESLSIQGYARSYGLTGAETRVLVELCKGLPPAKIASELGVAISTVRSQIGSVRLKTGAASIRALVRQIAVLPPVKGTLRG
ncbi:MAG: LuxR C-terminal-related transcriptional regulator, partial [Pseudomonadota bacterium]|nr:LuxR C-terminal-related transcriptional regulator [Pseudomonadota bacterium]